jgi:hypothetical protein
MNNDYIWKGRSWPVINLSPSFTRGSKVKRMIIKCTSERQMMNSFEVVSVCVYICITCRHAHE